MCKKDGWVAEIETLKWNGSFLGQDLSKEKKSNKKYF